MAYLVHPLVLGLDSQKKIINKINNKIKFGKQKNVNFFVFENFENIIMSESIKQLMEFKIVWLLWFIIFYLNERISSPSLIIMQEIHFVCFKYYCGVN